MSEAKKLTAPQEEVLRQSMYWGEKNAIAAQIWATLDAERAKVEALEGLNAAAAADGLSKIADHWRARATAAEAEAERMREALESIAEERDAGRHDGLPEPCPAHEAEVMWHIARAALAKKEKPDAAE